MQENATPAEAPNLWDYGNIAPVSVLVFIEILASSVRVLPGRYVIAKRDCRGVAEMETPLLLGKTRDSRQNRHAPGVEVWR